MKIIQYKKNHLNLNKVKVESLVNLSFIMFFASPLIEIAVNYIFSKLGIIFFSKYFTILLIYAPLFLACIVSPNNIIKSDFIILLGFIVSFFLATYMIHPEYKFWYFRKGYGVWDHIFYPTNGIYAYLFIRLIKDPKELIILVKKSGFLMIIFFCYQIYQAKVRGYWIGVAGLNGEAKFSYSVPFGYDVLFFLVFFIFSYIKEKKIIDLTVIIFGIISIFLYGSRGTIFSLIFLFLSYFIRGNIKSAKDIFKNIMLLSFCYIILINIENINNFLITVLSKYDLNSRFFKSIVNNRVFKDNGRFYMWEVTIAKLRQKPLGYGFLGTRSYLTNFIIAGYPHNIILEVLSDFGIVIGGIMIMLYTFKYAKIMMDTDSHYSDLLAIMSPMMVGLLISFSFWNKYYFWVTLAIIMNYNKYERRRIAENVKCRK